MKEYLLVSQLLLQYWPDEQLTREFGTIAN